MATCVDVSGAEYPERYNGNDVQALEGTPLTPSSTARPNGRRRCLWEHEGNCAVRKAIGSWCADPAGDWELYDIVENRTETEDVAAENPEVVAELITIFDAWAARCKVQPWAHVRDVMREKRRR